VQRSRRGPDDVRHLCREQRVRFLQLQFTDILGVVKHVTLPISQLEKALAGEVIVDGSAIEGFVRLREADIYLRPDPQTFCIFPWKSEGGATARMICDLYGLDGAPFPEDPRQALRRVCSLHAERGYVPMVGAEPEFFLFKRDPSGKGTTVTHDLAGYFDMGPLDQGESLREEIVSVLLEMGFDIASSHHEAAPGQHEIDLRYTDALSMADGLVTFRTVVRTVAALRGMHATFMPKPLVDVNGSGLHLHLSLFRGETNAFYDPSTPDQLSAVARHYLAGILAHARGFTAITNPLVNSYKRLVPGYEAPVFVTWSQREHSPLVRVPARRAAGTRIEVRSPDPACNPYLALAAILRAGLDGLDQRAEPPRQAGAAVYRMTAQERENLGIVPLPADLGEALAALEADEIVQEALGPQIFSRFTEAKRIEWDYYRRQVHQWELDQYLSTF
jgi:glutamine synthetase